MGQQAGNNNNNNQKITNSTRLRIVVPVKDGFTEFVDVKRDPTTKELISRGFAIDMFKAIVNSAMPYTVLFDFYPYERPNGSMNGTYDDMLRAVSSGDYDAAVGDISIRYFRTEMVDFTMAYSETGVSMLVPLRLKPGKTGTLFLRRLPQALIGAVVGEIAAIKRTRLVTVLCILILVVLTTCLGAIMISLQIAPKRTPLIDQHINDFIRNGKNVGYQTGSFVHNVLTQRGFSESQLKPYSAVEQLLDLLSKGSAQGGVDAAFDETPFLKLFLTQYCNAYTLLPSAALHGDGFGFAFRKETFTDLVRDISIATLKVTNNEVQLREIKDRTIGDLDSCRLDLTADEAIDSGPSMWILIAGIIGIVALMFIVCPVVISKTNYTIAKGRLISLPSLSLKS
ncbi:glutamate receptor 2.6-like [Amaranthus tricolor]|uniref:glutamate receptor 2.6-like n=1 Tax=Amaranthus tricolor TaxID=29722 RepID=UPI00258D933E|nr:glutamate receptor 2.6-like [Amaranthus tricolor]